MEHTPRPEQLLADAAWLDRVARALVRDPATADDLVQETWIAALRRRALGGRVGRAWLGLTLRSRLWNRRREEASRAARERIPIPREVACALSFDVRTSSGVPYDGPLLVQLTRNPRTVTSSRGEAVAGRFLFLYSMPRRPYELFPVSPAKYLARVLRPSAVFDTGETSFTLDVQHGQSATIRLAVQ